MNVGFLRIIAWKCYRYGIIICSVDTVNTSQRFVGTTALCLDPKKRNIGRYKPFLLIQIQTLSINSTMFTYLGISIILLLEQLIYFLFAIDCNPTSRPVVKLIF